MFFVERPKPGLVEGTENPRLMKGLFFSEFISICFRSLAPYLSTAVGTEFLVYFRTSVNEVSALDFGSLLGVVGL